MKSALLQCLAITVFAVAAGAAYNTANPNPEKRLPWLARQYKGMDTLPPTAPAKSAEAGKAAAPAPVAAAAGAPAAKPAPAAPASAAESEPEAAGGAAAAPPSFEGIPL